MKSESGLILRSNSAFLFTFKSAITHNNSQGIGYFAFLLLVCIFLCTKWTNSLKLDLCLNFINNFTFNIWFTTQLLLHSLVTVKEKDFQFFFFYVGKVGKPTRDHMCFSTPLDEACLYSQNERLENKSSDFIFWMAVRVMLLELLSMD